MEARALLADHATRARETFPADIVGPWAGDPGKEASRNLGGPLQVKLLVLMVTAAAIGTDFWMVRGSRLSLEAAGDQLRCHRASHARGAMAETTKLKAARRTLAA
jgi:hypothetical protein